MYQVFTNIKRGILIKNKYTLTNNIQDFARKHNFLERAAGNRSTTSCPQLICGVILRSTTAHNLASTIHKVVASTICGKILSVAERMVSTNCGALDLQFCGLECHNSSMSSEAKILSLAKER